MNYGMCRINKGARLKRADICPNLYFFTISSTFLLFQGEMVMFGVITAQPSLVNILHRILS